MKKPLKEKLKQIGGKHLLKEGDMSTDLERILRSKGGISLWNMDMKNMNWTHPGPERKYKKLYSKFMNAFEDLRKFVKDADKKGWY